LKIRLLSLAFDDLDAGRRFYEQQHAGLGGYFLDSLFSDIDSLLPYAGIHQKVLATTARCRAASPTPSITVSRARRFMSGAFSIAARIPRRSQND
jgi:hypothetical protein